MRNIKYIEFILSIINFGAFFSYVYFVEEPSDISLIILITIDLLIKISFKVYTNRLRSESKVVLIEQAESNWTKFTNNLSLVFTLLWATFVIINFDLFTNNKVGFVLPVYIFLALFLFSNKRGDFYIDKLGFIQPELFKKNYSWDEIENFSINKDAIEFKLDDKDYNIPINEETKIKLKNLNINYQI